MQVFNDNVKFTQDELSAIAVSLSNSINNLNHLIDVNLNRDDIKMVGLLKIQKANYENILDKMSKFGG